MASKLDDLLGNVVDRLKSVGIGVKNKYDIEAETDPYIRYIRTGGYVRGEPFTPEIAEARRRYMARKKAQQTAAPQDYRTPSNIQAQAGQGTIGDQVSYYNLNPTDPATSYSDMTRSSAATADGMGGYGQGGLFTPADRVSTESKGVTPSSRGLSGVQAASDFFNFFTPPENVTRGLPEDEANTVIDTANTYFSGELPMPKWRVQDAEASSLGTDNRGNPLLSREEFDANIEANLENLRLRRRFPEQGPPPNYRGGFEGTGEFADIPTIAEPTVRTPSVDSIDPEQVYRERQAQAPLRLQVLSELIKQGRVDRRQAGNPYVERLIDIEIAKMQESTPETGLFDTRALGNPFNAEVNEARQRYNEANSMDAMPPEPPAIVQEAPVVRSSQATLVDNAEDTKKFTDMGFSDDEWEAYKEGVTDVESRTSGEYTAQRKLKGGGKSQFLGRYQMGRDARSDAAKALGIKNPTEKEFLENPELQDKMFLEYTRSNYRALMRTSPEFRALSPEERKMVIAQAQLGAGNIKEALKSGKDFADSFGTKSTKWYKSVKKRLEALKNKGKQPEFDDSSVMP